MMKEEDFEEEEEEDSFVEVHATFGEEIEKTRKQTMLKKLKNVESDSESDSNSDSNLPQKYQKQHKQQPTKAKPKDHLFTVLFVKCPLESCLEFALTVKGINRHLTEAHGIIAKNRCIATERCAFGPVHFATSSLLQKHIEEEHLAADDFTYFQCYKCNRSTHFQYYTDLERHYYFNHDEGHFVCARCEGEKEQQQQRRRRDPATGCREYHFSGKYRGDVVRHWRAVHD